MYRTTIFSLNLVTVPISTLLYVSAYWSVFRFNHKMLLFSSIFLVSAYYFTTYLGSVGFLLANALNMVARIIHRWDVTKIIYFPNAVLFTKKFSCVSIHNWLLSTVHFTFINITKDQCQIYVGSAFSKLAHHLQFQIGSINLQLRELHGILFDRFNCKYI